MEAIEVDSLTKEFGDFKAVDGISFKVEEGEIFGFLGPNGAGKSTTMMILTTLLKPTSGRALVGGYDVMSDAKKVREKIGYVQQEISVDEFLTGRENLYLHARINQIPRNLIKSRIDDVLELVELGEKKDQASLTYSGGMRKRLDIANGLLSRPSVLFLDEPTPNRKIILAPLITHTHSHFFSIKILYICSSLFRNQIIIKKISFSIESNRSRFTYKGIW